MTNIFKSLSYGILFGATALPTLALAESGDTLAAVKSRGELLCGVHPARHGFAAPDSQGNWAGLEVDYCRAIAAAVLGDAEKVRYVALSSQQRFPAIQSGEVDVLVRNVTATLSRDTALGLNFAPPVFYTGTGFLVHKASGVETVDDLDGATICVAPGSTTERNVAQIFASRGMEYTPVVIENNKQLVDAYVTGRCDALTKDKAALPGVRAYDTTDPEEHVLLPGIFSKEPLAPAVRQGDDQWYDIVKWVVYATFNAEEMGVTSENAAEMKSSEDVNIQSLLGTTGDYGSKLGLTEDWAYDIITQVGNYEEIYDRHFGPDSAVQLDRDLNTLWDDGGLLYGFPIK